MKGKREKEREKGTERSKVASKQTNRNEPTVINDHPVVILSPIRRVTPREEASLVTLTSLKITQASCESPINEQFDSNKLMQMNNEA